MDEDVLLRGYALYTLRQVKVDIKPPREALGGLGVDFQCLVGNTNRSNGSIVLGPGRSVVVVMYLLSEFSYIKRRLQSARGCCFLKQSINNKKRVTYKSKRRSAKKR